MNVVIAKANYYVVKAGNVYAMFLGSRSIKYRQLAVHYVLQRNEQYRIFSPVRNKISEYYKKKSYGNIPDLLDSLTYGEFRYTPNSNSMALFDLDSEGLIKEMKSLNQTDFVKWLRIDKGMTLTEITEFDIDVSQHQGEEQGVVDFHGAKVLIDPAVKGKKKEEVFGYIDIVRKRLDAHGFGYVFPGDIVIAPLADTKAGWYFKSSKEMHIDPTCSKEVVEILYHEYAHKLFHLFLKDEQKGKIKSAYSENIKKTDTKKTEIRFYKDQLHVGQKVKYLGSKFKQYHDEILTIKALGPSFLNIDTGLTTLTIPWQSVPDNVILADGKRIKKFTSTKSSDMFPTEYSKTDSEEWFAECFAFYLMDRASKGINDFLGDLFAENKATSSTEVGWQEVWEHWKKNHTGEVSEGTPELKARVEKYGPYVLQKVKIKDIDIDFSKELDCREDEEYAVKRYAPLKTQAPAIVLYKKKNGKYSLIDGRHRSRAAFLRGEPEILAYVGSEK